MSKNSPLIPGAQQIALLSQVDLNNQAEGGDFERTIHVHGLERIVPKQVDIFQINVGKLCNMTCRHCHVDAGPDRKVENMNLETINLCLKAMDKVNTSIVDITGGAPELNPHFRYLIDQCVSRGKHVMDRCNLTVLLIPRFEDLPEWFAERGVEVVCSLPHYRKRNTDEQRGEGTFEKSIEALRRLNAAGYGRGDPRLRLTLVSNPSGAFLSGDQTSLEKEWKEGLLENHRVSFDSLISINNMPISRFLEWLQNSGNLEKYMEVLVNAFNPKTLNGLMCRNTISIGWDGRVYDCDFNQMLELQSHYSQGNPVHISNLDLDLLQKRKIVTNRHCFGCTAGSGSSCGGAIA